MSENFSFRGKETFTKEKLRDWNLEHWVAFWECISYKEGMRLKAALYYNLEWTDDDSEGEESCDYTGEECIGDKRFCEECPVLTDEEEEDSHV